MERQCYVNSGACLAGEPAGAAIHHPRSAGRGTDTAPRAWLQTCLFSLCLPRFWAAAAGSGVLSCRPPPSGGRGAGRGFKRLPPRHPFGTSKARPALSVPAGSGPENVIRGGRCRAGPARALRSRWGPWIPRFATSSALVTAPLAARASLRACLLGPRVPAGQPSPLPGSGPLSSPPPHTFLPASTELGAPSPHPEYHP